MWHVRVLLPILTTLCLLPGLADADEYWKRSGWYLGVNGVYGFNFFEDEIRAAGSEIDLDYANTGGIDARVGYRVNSWFAVEFNYEWMNEFYLSSSLGDGTWTFHTFTVAPKVVLPRWRVQPYFLFGIGGQFSSFEDRSLLQFGDEESFDFALRPAVGLDYFVSENWVLNFEFGIVGSVGDLSRPGDDINDIVYLSVGGGIQYRF